MAGADDGLTPEQLWHRYLWLAVWVAGRFAASLPPEGDRDGLHGECRLALWESAAAWRPDGGMGFPGFARTHLERAARLYRRYDRRRGFRFTGDVAAARGGRPPPLPRVATASGAGGGGRWMEAGVADHRPDPRDAPAVPWPAVLAAVPPHARYAVWLVFRAGLTYAEAGRRLKARDGRPVTRQRVEQLVRAAVARLRRDRPGLAAELG